MKKPQAEEGLNCPLHQKDMSKVCHKCAWYVMVRGDNPQTGEPVDAWDCAIAWGPVLEINTAQQVRQTNSSVDHFRNEMVKANETSNNLSAMLARFSTNFRPAPQGMPGSPPADLIEGPTD